MAHGCTFISDFHKFNGNLLDSDLMAHGCTFISDFHKFDGNLLDSDLMTHGCTFISDFHKFDGNLLDSDLMTLGCTFISDFHRFDGNLLDSDLMGSYCLMRPERWMINSSQAIIAQTLLKLEVATYNSYRNTYLNIYKIISTYWLEVNASFLISLQHW